MSNTDQLSEDDRALYKNAFAMFDRDGDGSIKVEELGTVMRSLGKNLTDADVKEMISEVDEDASGSVGLSEFLTLMLRKASDADVDEEIRETFRIFDRDGDGYISAGELCDVMACLGEKISAHEAEVLLSQAVRRPKNDKQKQAALKISYEEFRAVAAAKK